MSEAEVPVGNPAPSKTQFWSKPRGFCCRTSVLYFNRVQSSYAGHNVFNIFILSRHYHIIKNANIMPEGLLSMCNEILETGALLLFKVEVNMFATNTPIPFLIIK